MKQSPRKVGLVASTVLALTMALTVATASTASADPPDLSSDLAINAYLVSIGVDPAEAVWQRGLKNYAGPGCPGAGWNCVRANAPIVQIAAPLGTNLFYCTGLDCVVVQVALSGGQNGGACDRTDKQSATAVQVCDITQANDGNPNSSNNATINQNIQQRNGPAQDARQVARITQENTLGRNHAIIHQVIGQTQNARGGASITQSQEAHQAGTVEQLTTNGANTSSIDQRQKQSQRASGSSGLVTQKQNTDPGADFFCDQPADDPDFDQEKNQCAEVLQNSSVVPATGGSIQSRLNQDITESQAASNAGSVDQDQGTFPGGPGTPGGQGGTVVQNSSAPDDSDAIQNTLQVQRATGIAAGVSLGDQFKNTGDPRCCATQTVNPGSTADITQTTNQFASSGDNAVQLASLQGDCNSSGTCNVEQSATVNGETTTNDCSGSFCHIVIECFSLGEGEGTACVASEGGDLS